MSKIMASYESFSPVDPTGIFNFRSDNCPLKPTFVSDGNLPRESWLHPYEPECEPLYDSSKYKQECVSRIMYDRDL